MSYDCKLLYSTGLRCLVCLQFAQLTDLNALNVGVM